MRATVAIVLSGMLLGACSKGENAGAEEARKEAEAEQAKKVGQGGAAKKISPPVPGSAHIPCDQLIDVAKFGAAMGEKEPMTIKDATKGEAEAAASCSLVRGGKRPTDAEQKALLKQNGRLGVMPGDDICNVAAFCWTIEDSDRFKAKCKARKDKDDDSMGSYACVQVVAVGADDVQVFRFFDEDTKCILQVRGGPSNVDNDLIRNCAKAARDSIGADQIAVPAASK